MVLIRAEALLQSNNRLKGMDIMNIPAVVTRLFLLSVLIIGETAASQDRREALILGDSVAFSYISSVGFEYFYTNPENFIGFPNELGVLFHLDVVNASCPGETTGSFLSSTAADNGCRGYRGLFSPARRLQIHSARIRHSLLEAPSRGTPRYNHLGLE